MGKTSSKWDIEVLPKMKGCGRINPKCGECMRLWRIFHDTQTDEALEDLYKHLGRKLHPIK